MSEQKRRAVWTCDVCDKPILNGDGRFEISNGDPARGRVGGYPRARLDEPASHRGLSSGRPSKESVLALVDEWSDPPIRFAKHHHVCASEYEPSPYVIAIDTIETLAGLCGWINHLSLKNWFGADEIRRLILSWAQAAEGVDPYASGPSVA